MQRLKLCLVGDKEVGKSSLRITYKTRAFPGERVTYEDCVTVLRDVELWDSAGMDKFDCLRSVSYLGTDVFLVCFSVESRESLDNVRDKWIPEIRMHCPDTPVILVACKTDLRDKSRWCITYDEGYAVAKEIKAVEYVETSAKKKEELDSCFEL